MGERFSIENYYKNISFEQYKKTAEKLESSIRKVNPNITSSVLLTTNRDDYNGWGSMTMDIPEIFKDDIEKKKECNLKDLTKNLWEKSLEVELWIKDKTSSSTYFIVLSNEERNKNSMYFLGTGLNNKEQMVFDSFKKTGLFQKLGNGHPKSSDFSVGYSSANLMQKK